MQTFIVRIPHPSPERRDNAMVSGRVLKGRWTYLLAFNLLELRNPQNKRMGLVEEDSFSHFRAFRVFRSSLLRADVCMRD